MALATSSISNDIYAKNNSLIKSTLEIKESKQSMITFQTSKSMYDLIDNIVESGSFNSRSAFIRHVICEYLKQKMNDPVSDCSVPEPKTEIKHGTDERGNFIVVKNKKFYFKSQSQ